jgi:transposase-like protein
VARDHDIAPGQLFTWRRQLLAEAIANGVGTEGFVPVEIANERGHSGCQHIRFDSK